MPERDHVRFSETGEYVAISGTDGRLRIWETATSTLKQEFTPATHLTTGCTCLEWSPSRQPGSKKKKKKVLDGDIIVMGTNIGSLLFYDMTKAQLIAHSKEAHAKEVTGLSWSPTTLSLYSCGKDGYLLEWDPSTTTPVHRWLGSKHAITAVCVFNNNLLVSSRGINLWDLTTKTILSSFTGHPKEILRMTAIPSSDYFISMAQDDRHLKIWSTGERNSLVSLVVPDTPLHYHVMTQEASGEVSIAVVTNRGRAHVFQKKLNGPMRKPLMPISTLIINDTSGDATANTSNAISVLTCFLRQEEGSTSLLASYGNSIRFRFEKFDVAELEKMGPIVREFSSKGKHDKSSNSTSFKNQKQQLTVIRDDVKHLQPGTETLAGTASSVTGGKKRKKSEIEAPQADGELPMEERLTNLTLESASGLGSGIRGNNLGHLLSQGLHSKDTRILHSVLSKWDEEVITNTVRSLPVQLVLALLKEIKVMLAGKGQTNNTILKWLKSVLQIHSSYLMCCPGADELLGPFMSLLHSREVLYPQLCQLRGKLELIKGNIDAKQHKAEPVNEALLVFNDEPSGDEDEGDEEFMAESEEDFLTSDDLGGSDSDEDEKVTDNEDDKSDDSGSKTDSESEDSEVEKMKNNIAAGGKATTNSKTKKKTLSKSKSNHVANEKSKIKGIVLDEDSGPESMDDDG